MTSSSSRTPASTLEAAKVNFDFHRPPGGSSGGGLSRVKKPQPLTGLPIVVTDDLLLSTTSQQLQLKPKTPPRTPLIPSPDCLAVEERVRHLMDGGGGSGAGGGGGGAPLTDLEKLRNLSVSSADFNFEAGGSSLPSTPSFRPQFFHIPGLEI